MSLPIAIQLYSLREDASEDFFGTLKKVKELGYDGVEFAGLFDNEPEMVRAFCEEIGLVPLSAHVPFDALISETDAVIAECRALGCKYVAVPYVTEENRPGAEGFFAAIDAICEVGRACATAGLQLLYHNHDFEFVKVNGEYGLDVIYSEIAPEYLQTEIDTCWVNVAGEDPAKYVEKYTGRAPVVHLKDFFKKGSGGKLYELIGLDDDSEEAGEETFGFKPVGHGQQDMPSILAACVKAGASWVVIEQDRPDGDNEPIREAEKSIAYLKSIVW
ncbi:MAG: sugar phosphate isomerase/epimerase [Oscillospiraceae bacterium]|nr:sugar phosphate isomerase/epimerase [Oscillospiraceae bacterium]